MAETRGVEMLKIMALGKYMSSLMKLEVDRLNSYSHDSTASARNEANKRVRSTVKKTKT